MASAAVPCLGWGGLVVVVVFLSGWLAALGLWHWGISAGVELGWLESLAWADGYSVSFFALPSTD
jgi:hypothetical protein